eukprot:g12244.t1
MIGFTRLCSTPLCSMGSLRPAAATTGAFRLRFSSAADADGSSSSNNNNNSSSSNSALEKKKFTPKLEQEAWVSQASRTVVTAKHRGIRSSPQKMNEICRMARKLNAKEAITQLRFAQKPKAAFVANCIRNAANAGVNNFGMDPDRLLVVECYAAPAGVTKMLDIRARGKIGIIRKRRSNLRVVLHEVPPAPKEERLGKQGRNQSTIQHLTERLKSLGKEYANPLKFKSTQRFK